MTLKLVIGLDGETTGDKAVAFGQKLAKAMGGGELLLVYVIEWSPYSFQTPEENAERHKRREEEIDVAQSRVLQPAVKKAQDTGFNARGLVRHGHVAETLEAIAKEESADQIIVARASGRGLASRIFGSSTAQLVMGASIPVTVVV